jgi:nicotinamide mononucleotide adenylyltransferase
MLMALGKDEWVTLVPEPVRDFINRVNGVERVRKLAIIEGVLRGNP